MRGRYALLKIFIFYQFKFILLLPEETQTMHAWITVGFEIVLRSLRTLLTV